MGTVLMWAPNFPPRNWAYCSGQMMSIAQYEALFALLGTQFGGDGRTTFQLPDMRGRVAVGEGAAPGMGTYRMGEMLGSDYQTLTISQMPEHKHTMSGGTMSLEAASGEGTTNTPGPDAYLAEAVVSGGGDRVNIYAENPRGKTTLGGLSGTVEDAPAGGSQPFSIMQPSLVLGYIICLQGIFPSRGD